MKQRLLVIDDEAGICSSLSFAFEDRFVVEAFTDPRTGLARAADEGFDLCFLDLRIGTTDGLSILDGLMALAEPPAVVMMTAFGSIASSVEAMRRGAFGYVTKPLDMDELTVVAVQALDNRNLHRKVEYLSHELEGRYGHAGMVGKSPGMNKLFSLVERLKDVDTTVIIQGESGTGKELVARALHYSGRRKTEPFVEVNCAAIPEALLEGELFGYRRGAFTGAVEARIGRFAYAGTGTLFLDEIGDMPPAIQAKLLRALQERSITPLGSNEAVKVSARVVAASNIDLTAEVEAGRFRKDLYFRLKVMELYIPPLRERMEDIPLLLAHFIRKYNAELSREVRGLTEEARRCLLAWHFPGNVRELANLVERAILLSDSPYIDVDDLPEELLGRPPDCAELDDRTVFRYLAGRRLDEVEEGVIRETLARNAGKRKQSADELGISERGLRNKLSQYGLGRD
jgi:two-component system response regulator AtoC